MTEPSTREGSTLALAEIFVFAVFPQADLLHAKNMCLNSSSLALVVVTLLWLEKVHGNPLGKLILNLFMATRSGEACNGDESHLLIRLWHHS